MDLRRLTIMKMKIVYILFFLLGSISFFSCDDHPKEKEKVVYAPPKRLAPNFEADSAYLKVKAQVDFGPRTPGSAAHKNCSDWIINTLKPFTPYLQYNGGPITAYDGKKIEVKNIIASFAPENPKRIMLSAHFDTRPWADNDPNPENHKTPVPGANDGASGVGVLLELARLFHQKSPGIGVDLFFWDAEDYGAMKGNIENTFCYGSQYWAKHLHQPAYKAEFGINLDMVGAAGARFPKEGFSRQYASSQVEMIWAVARELGYGQIFVDFADAPIIDDHYYVNLITGIPCVDVIDRRPGTDSFFMHWHTVKDDMESISTETLKAVGQTVAEVVYRQGPIK